jgi:hypothetical protein
MKTRLHLYPHRGPKTKAYIVAEQQAFKQLAKAADAASKSVIGLETVTFYTSDGHEFELFLVSDVKETEWQDLVPPYTKNADPGQLKIVELYNDLNKD